MSRIQSQKIPPTMPAAAEPKIVHASDSDTDGIEYVPVHCP
ncbi:MAG: hypothetical protein WBE40_01435 [Thermoplasmata archaeon]